MNRYLEIFSLTLLYAEYGPHHQMEAQKTEEVPETAGALLRN